MAFCHPRRTNLYSVQNVVLCAYLVQSLVFESSILLCDGGSYAYSYRAFYSMTVGFEPIVMDADPC